MLKLRAHCPDCLGFLASSGLLETVQRLAFAALPQTTAALLQLGVQVAGPGGGPESEAEGQMEIMLLEAFKASHSDPSKRPRDQHCSMDSRARKSLGTLGGIVRNPAGFIELYRDEAVKKRVYEDCIWAI